MNENNHLDRDTVNMLNVLTLLKDKPMTYEELRKSGYFKRTRNLDIALAKLKRTNRIEKIRDIEVWVIMSKGIRFLSGHPYWQLVQVKVLDHPFRKTCEII